MINFDERDAMIAAADDWGPPNDENRQWFFSGWINRGSKEQPSGDHQSNMGPWAAYNSGTIAQREHDLEKRP